MPPTKPVQLLARRWSLAAALAAVSVLAAAPSVAAADLAVRTGDEALAAAVRGGGFFRWMAQRAETTVEVGPEAQGEREIVAAAWPLEERFAPLAEGLPLGGDGGTIRFGGREHPADRVVVVLRRPRVGKGEPEWLVVGGEAERVAAGVTQVLVWLVFEREEPPDYLVREGSWLERRGAWRRVADGWATGAGERDDFAARERWLGGLVPASGRAPDAAARPAVELLVPGGRGGGPAPHLAALGGELDGFAHRALARLPLELAEPLRVAVEPDFESQGRHTGRIGAAVPGTVADLHLVWHERDGWGYRYAVAGELVERAVEGGALSAGLPPWLRRGAALWLASQWYGRPYREWLPRLAAAGAFPDAATLLDGEVGGAASEPLWTPVAAAVIDRLPGRTLAEKLAGVPERGAVERAVEAVRGAALAAAEELPPARPPGPLADERFLSGVSLAMHNSLEGGYHARSVDAALERLAALGADAVSIMPFAYQGDPSGPGLRFLNRGPSSETDVGVVHAARRADARGFRVLWKPHLWIGWESWPGDVAMDSEAEWAAWWEEYRTYVLHHAFLAAWAGAEVLSVGVELVGTLEHEAEWRRLIADVRRLYPGAVTYSANWHGGVEGVGFWDALDYVGVDAYWPLAGERATGEELILGARAVAERLAELHVDAERPLLLTEVGFAARRGAWVEPHAEGGALSERDQARAYRALIAAFGRHPEWLAGVFVWKAFSGGPERTDRPDFRFLGREAEGVVGAWFRGER